LASDSCDALWFYGHYLQVAQFLSDPFGENGFILSQLIWVKIVILKIWRIWTCRFLGKNVLGIDTAHPGMKQNFFNPSQRPQPELFFFLQQLIKQIPDLRAELNMFRKKNFLEQNRLLQRMLILGVKRRESGYELIQQRAQ
jgi:hypothetical protein